MAKYEVTSRQVQDTAETLGDTRYAHLGQQTTFLENALQKIEQKFEAETGANGDAGKLTRSVRRIVSAMLRGQGVQHPAVELLKEAGQS